MFSKVLLPLSLALTLSLSLSGCHRGPVIPENVPISIVVINSKGQPLNKVKVRLIPQLDGLDGNFIARGTTDDQGRCSPSLPGKEKSGVPACRHKVQVTEAGMSDEARRAYEDGDVSLSIKEKKSLKNRPFPKEYTRLLSTPLEIEVTPDQTEIELKLE